MASRITEFEQEALDHDREVTKLRKELALSNRTSQCTRCNALANDVQNYQAESTKIRARLAELADVDNAIRQRDSMIRSLRAKLGAAKAGAIRAANSHLSNGHSKKRPRAKSK